jgi:hypothetical protein
MSSITLTITGLNYTASDLRLGVNPDSREQLERLTSLLDGIQGGNYSASFDISSSTTNAVKASGTLTLSGGAGAVGGTIGGTLVTATWATSDTISAGLIAAAVNANTTVNKLVTATSSGAVVTLTANLAGPVGNKILLVASGTGVTASGAALTAGAGNDGQPTTYNLS